jgi:rfaE bifunctional protein nucleotidyltransferase chain/domain
MSEVKSGPGKLLVLASDHNGVAFKCHAKKHLKEWGYHCIDLGPYTLDQKVDYVDYAATLAHIIDAGEAPWGVLICGTGVGMSIVANRFPNVRASLVHSLHVAQKSREHNDANVICLGSWVNSDEDNVEILHTWLSERFGEGRHVKRVEKTKQPIREKEKVVFANGIFDLLHTGHIALLRFAKSLGGRLVVGINSDRATKLLKGPERPLNNEVDRKAVLENLECVDEVIIFDDVAPTDLVRTLHPDIVVKGAEWTSDDVRRRDQVPDDIEVKVFPLMMQSAGPKYSTTALVQKVRGAASA